MARQTKRLWSDEEKRSICLQTTAPEVSVAQVARRYALNANMIFKWLREGAMRLDRRKLRRTRPASCLLRLWTVPVSKCPGRSRPTARSRSSLRAGIGCGSAGLMIPRLWPG